MNKVQKINIKGEDFVFLPYTIYNNLLETVEDAEDIACARAISERISVGEETFPSDLVYKIIDGMNKVKAFRKYRKMTQKELAEAVGISTAQIKKIESDDSDGSLKTLRAIAKVLRVDTADLV